MRVVVYVIGKMPDGQICISWDMSKRKKTTGRKCFSFRPIFDLWEIYELNIRYY